MREERGKGGGGRRQDQWQDDNVERADQHHLHAKNG